MPECLRQSQAQRGFCDLCLEDVADVPRALRCEGCFIMARVILTSAAPVGVEKEGARRCASGLNPCGCVSLPSCLLHLSTTVNLSESEALILHLYLLALHLLLMDHSTTLPSQLAVQSTDPRVAAA